MMTETETETPGSAFNWRKLALQLISGLIAGGLVGYGAGYWAGNYAETQGLDDVPLSIEIAGLVAVVYILIASIVLAGSMSPRLGARFLNLEDADEVREMQLQLVNSGIAMLLWGLALLGLALAAPVGPLAAPVALTICAGGLLAGLGFAWKTYRNADELMLAMNIETAAITYGLVVLVLGGWGMLGHLGYLPAPLPIDILTACYVLVMVATYIAIGRRGLLKVR